MNDKIILTISPKERDIMALKGRKKALNKQNSAGTDSSLLKYICFYQLVEIIFNNSFQLGERGKEQTKNV